MFPTPTTTTPPPTPPAPQAVDSDACSTLATWPLHSRSTRAASRPAPLATAPAARLRATCAKRATSEAAAASGSSRAASSATPGSAPGQSSRRAARLPNSSSAKYEEEEEEEDGSSAEEEEAVAGTAGAGLTKTGNTLDVGAGTGIQVNADDIALATSNVLSLFNLATSGVVARTAANTVAARTITGTANRITITNGDGVAGNPTLDIASTYVGQNTITTLGTITTGTWNGSTLAVGYGGTGVAALTGLVKGNGAAAFSAAVDGADYLSPNATLDGGTF